MDFEENFSFFLSDAYTQGSLMHEIFTCMFILPYVWYLLVLFSHKTYLSMNNKIYFIMPITFFLLSVAIVTGIFLLSMRGFIFDLRIILMIIVCYIFLAGEIYRLVTLKKAKTSLEGMKKYTKFCKIMYFLFLLLYFIVIGFSKAYKG
ncbi:hypothetical protein CQA53_01140 [Helicobacter didelphidarum]|uniref:TerC family integral membrane protein n=1 Tax=Helicobacter didelphidarum TaxID=2040648 RepID=A0A3D8IQV6_9HELI|nr:hypothetical protein [Helicobacter didelphidarum]RDU67639.1 hypothetical protein CQA53_01140 [Helicobacter didelphidarum]